MSHTHRKHTLRRHVSLKWKPKPPGVTALARRKKRMRIDAAERAAKRAVLDRDKRCRFPRCGCRREWRDPMKAALTVSHDFHKGMGGDPTGGVSIPSLMLALCKWRHQDGQVSRDRKTMRTRYLTPDNNDGPLAFEIDLHAFDPDVYHETEWFEIARETYTDDGRIVLERPTEQQLVILEELAEMKR